MTTMEVISQLNSLIDDRKSFIDDNGQGDDIYLNDISALTAAIEAISTSSEGKLYTALDVIRIVQAAVSDAVCGMSREESTVTAYEIERDIVSRLVGGDSSERESRGLATGRRRNVELQITTASNNSTGLKSCREEQNHDDQTGD